jgi:hypothetical protein
MRPLTAKLSGFLAVANVFGASAHAALPSPFERQNKVEDALADCDIDAEDFLALRMPRPIAIAGNRSGAYLALSAFARESGAGAERGGMLVLQLPIDRFFVPAASAGAGAISQETAPKPPPPAPAAPVFVVSPGDARACVKAALKAAGLGDETRLESIAARARTSAALPELRLRALRSVDQSGRLTYTEVDPYRYSEAGATGYTLEARLTFRLDRLLFADEEVSVERMHADRQEARTRIATKALAALFEWQRAYALEKSPTLTSEEHLGAVLRIAETGAALDVLTDGWFSRWRGAAEPGPSAK